MTLRFRAQLSIRIFCLRAFSEIKLSDMKKALLLSSLFVFIACSREEVVVQVVRNPLIQFSSSSFTWKADSYSFRDPVQVVQYPANTSQPGRVYNRYTMQATGRDDRGQRLQLTLSFDASDIPRLTGEYRPTYTANRGLAGVQLYNLEQASLASYRLNDADTATARLLIQRHSETEQLMSGSFQMTLSDERDPTKKIVITNGILNDVRYNP
jgi:hypothetical protein